MKSKNPRFFNMTKNVIPVLIVLLSLFGCTDKDDCTGFCTEEFKSIRFTIKDADGSQIMLDSFTVILTESNRDITEDLHFDPTFTNSYPIIDDSFFAEAKSNNLKVQFIGIVNDMIVIQENYVIGTDCCHIELISGETEITI